MNKWIQIMRPPFLVLAALLVLHGTALAAVTGYRVDWVHAVLALVALVLLHGSVNVLNDWHDFSRSGIDREIRRTPFSGGSGLLPEGVLTPRQALIWGIVTLAVGALIGIYLVWASGSTALLVIGIVGVLSVVLYTPLFTRIGLGELFAGLGLGTLPVVATYVLLTGEINATAWVSGIPAGLLTYNLLLLNEFPDAEVDARGGRKHLVVRLGKKNARWLYAAVEVLTYVVIVAGVLTGVLPWWGLLGLVGAYHAYDAIRGTMAEYDGFESLFPAMGANVNAVLYTNAFMAIGYSLQAMLG